MIPKPIQDEDEEDKITPEKVLYGVHCHGTPGHLGKEVAARVVEALTAAGFSIVETSSLKPEGNTTMANNKGVGPYSRSYPQLRHPDESTANNAKPQNSRTRLQEGARQLDIDTGNDVKGSGPLDRDA